MRRRISECKTVGRSTGGISLRMVMIGVRLITRGGMYTQDRRNS